MISSSSPTINEKPTRPALRVTLQGLGTAVPIFASTQENTLNFINQTFEVRDQTRQLYKKTFRNKSIEKRHFAVDRLEDTLEQNLDLKIDRFKRSAVDLAVRALGAALIDAGTSPAKLDYLVAATCTGYVCPGLSAYLVEACHLRSDIHLADLVGMGCGAALPAMEQAHNFLIAHPGASAAVVCVEICSAAMYSNDDIGIVISNAIFSDGAAALVMRSDAGGATGNGARPLPRVRAFSSRIIPQWRDTLRFETEGGHLKNVLGKHVPEQAGQAVRLVAQHLLGQAGLEPPDIDHWIMHAGGKKVIDALEKSLQLAPARLQSARTTLKNFGNMSSPTVLFVLEEEIKRQAPKAGAIGFMASFGAGFSAHGMLIEWI
ncbi:MAG: 3,5-dihydroxyphenylacetyl-CoA synthase [Elusimicrobia bacterium]|nr:3,5-dihydroxyphenylacetyl-CoA synthase [Elusimicrobiota bacterium]